MTSEQGVPAAGSTEHRCSVLADRPRRLMKYVSQDTLRSTFPLKLIPQIISFRWFRRGFILFIKLNRRSPQIALRVTFVIVVGFHVRIAHLSPRSVTAVRGVANVLGAGRVNGPTHMILIPSRALAHRQAYKIRIIFSFRGLPASATSSLIKTNSCLTQSYPAICEVLQAELRPQIILTPFNKAVMLIQSRRI